ncbi:Putative testis-expressed protein 13C [Lemmus lemmus]
MAVDSGDQASGFRHNEVIRFINNEILMNGGGPEFYMTFRMRPWNEIEDQLCTILVDPQVPRSLKRACTWSALALSVRVGARQREQQAYMVGFPQDSLGQCPLAPRISASELWQLRQQREEAITQLISTQAALQQSMRECEVLRWRLHHERSAQMTPLFHNVVPGAQTQQLGASVIPMNPDHTRVMGAMGGYTDSQYLETQMSAATNVLYMPGSTSPWPTAMQHSVPVPVPYQFPPHSPFLVGSPFLMPFSPPVVMETEGGVVPAQMSPPPVYPSSQYAAPCSQNPAGLWDQRCYMTPEGSSFIQHSVPPEDVRNFSQEGGSERTRETDIMGVNGKHIEGQDARRNQERATLVDIENDNKEEQEQEQEEQQEEQEEQQKERQEQEQEEQQQEEDEEEQDEEDDEEEEEGEENKEEEEEATTPVPAEAEEAAAAADDADAEAEAEAEAAEEKEKEEAAATYDNTVEALQILQQLHLPKEGELHSQSEKSPQASSLAPLSSTKSQIKEGVEETQSTPVWKSWSQVVREGPKKQQPELPKKKNKTQQAASNPHPVSGSGMNWVCSRCKAMNYSWRRVCFKCRR